MDDPTSWEYAIYRVRRQFEHDIIHKEPETPGPAEYDLTSVSFLSHPTLRPLGGTFGYSKRPTCDTSRISDNVGPGSYTPRALEGKGPKFSFGSSPRRDVFTPRRSRSEERPGPGAYSVGGAFEGKEHRVTSSFGKMTEKKLAIPKSETPGPGAYSTTDKNKPQNPKYSIYGKPRDPSPTSENFPGPGNYDVQSTLRKPQSTKGVIPLAPRMKEAKTHSAGPGSYDVRTQENIHPPPSIAKSERKPLFEWYQTTPGPGAYDVNKKKSTKQVPKMEFLLPHGSMVLPAAKHAPGPGAYNHTGGGVTDKGAPKWTITTKPKDPKPPKVPGPGEYAYQVSWENIPGGAMPHSDRQDPLTNKATSQIPGPGAYNPQNPTHTISSVPQQSSARICPILDTGRFVPGPGAYEAKSVESTHAAVFTGAMEEKVPETPGPGAYNPLAVDQSNGGAIKIPKAKRPPVFQGRKDVPGPGAYESGIGIAEEGKGPALRSRSAPVPTTAMFTPGPGAYTVSSERDPGVIIPKAMREDVLLNKANTLIPGPGAYEAQVVHDGRSVVFGSDTRMDRSMMPSSTPGPGAYTATLHGGEDREGRAYSIPQAPRVNYEFSNKDSSSIPGPGAYVPITNSTVYNASILERHPEKVQITPGPGEYVPAISSHDGPRVVFGKDSRFHDDISTSNMPGPGHYVPENTHGITSAQPPQVVFGSAPRLVEPKNDAPGPGAYAFTTTSGFDHGSGVSFTQSGRQDVFGAAGGISVPGPGSYNPIDGASGPQYTMGGKFSLPNPGVGVPGPGAYDIRGVALGAGGIAIGTAPRDQPMSTNVPGPGAYVIPSTIGAETQNGYIAPPSSVSQLTQANVVPGPGAYNLPTEPTSGVKIPSTGHSTLFAMTDVPGPGAYNCIKNVGEGLPAVTMSGAPRWIEVGAQNPGPGSYQPDAPSKPKGGVMAQAERPSQETHVDIPGPGTYTVTPLPQGPAVTMHGSH
eukprot:PhF_6_TR44232/c0_g1_i2/m.67992